MSYGSIWREGWIELLHNVNDVLLWSVSAPSKEFDGKFEEPFELLGLDDPECPKKEIRAAFRQVARPTGLKGNI